jgi:hypothetical protein
MVSESKVSLELPKENISSLLISGTGKGGLSLAITRYTSEPNSYFKPKLNKNMQQ